MKIGEEAIANLNDNYRRIRNTFRFILENIGTENSTISFNYSELEEIDKFILARLFQLDEIRRKNIKRIFFHVFYKALFEFCLLADEPSFILTSVKIFYTAIRLQIKTENKIHILFCIVR